MTPEEQRIAIAKAHGWKIIEGEHFKLLHGPHHPPGIGLACGKHLTADECFRAFFDSDETESIPDYLHDLNAMHGAENMITDDQWPKYRDLLSDLAFKASPPGAKWFRPNCCTAAQRAEAFLKTLGLWKD